MLKRVGWLTDQALLLLLFLKLVLLLQLAMPIPTTGQRLRSLEMGCEINQKV